eukprot:GFUD01014110.1.p1 GENE.GFUD01014110.1~~GFUD01014110.1.p1  ORF type:complete len:429 (+),score=113.97 GFUD01014110.1:97-1383(+)
MDTAKAVKKMRADVAGVQESNLSNEFEKISKEDCVEMEKAYNHQGMNGLKTYIDRNLSAWKKTPVNIAITGQSGSGKSSYINAVRNMDDDEHPDFAKVGITETTFEPKSYAFPNNKNVLLWDLPGAGTESFKTVDYAKQMDFGKYDSFVILSESRFTETDKVIANEIVKIRKNFYFVRKKMEDVMRNERKVRKKKIDETQIKMKIKKDCEEKLGSMGKVFLIDSFEAQEFDFQLLLKTLVKNLPAIKQKALVLTLQAKSMDIVDNKMDLLLERLPWIALKSAAVGAVPVPGVSAVYDATILVGEANFQKLQLGIDDASLSAMAKRLKMTAEKCKQQMAAASGDAALISGINMGVNAIVKTAIAQVVVSEGIESLIKTVPIIGSIIGAGMSGATSYAALRLMLESHKKMAEACLKVVADTLEEVKMKQD